MRANIGDVFVDEFRLVALELSIDLAPSAKGQLAEIVVEGRAPDGSTYKVPVKLVVDVHGGPHVVVRDAQRDILLLRCDAARAEARAHADRGANPAAVSLLREMIKVIEGSEGFVANDGTPLSEMREQLIDEAANYDRKASGAERQHQRKSAFQYTPTSTPTRRTAAMTAAALVGISQQVKGQLFQLYTDSSFGRSHDNEIPLHDASLSRRHARILEVDDKFVLMDLGSTNGCEVNGRRVAHDKAELKDGDIVKLGFVEFRFEYKKP